MRARPATTARWGVLLALCLSSCNGCEEVDTPEVTPTTTPSGERHLVAGIPVGTIEGVVRLADGEDEPSYPSSPFDVPTAGQVPASCSPPHGADRRPLAMDAARGLANVVVAASGDPAHWIGPGEPVTHEVHIRDCRLDPVTLAATTGDQLHVVNEIEYPFMPELGLGMLQSVLPTDPIDVTLDRAEPREVHCAFAAPCGRMELLTFRHPVHTVTTEGGHFRIENAPADQDLVLTAMHATIDAANATTRVTEGGTVQIEIIVHRHAAPPDAGPIVLPPGQEIDPGSPHDLDMTEEELRRLHEEAARLAAERAAAHPPTSTTPPPASSPPPTTAPPSSAVPAVPSHATQ